MSDEPCHFCDGEGVEHILDSHSDSLAEAEGFSERRTVPCPVCDGSGFTREAKGT